MSVSAEIRERLEQSFAPEQLEVLDESEILFDEVRVCKPGD